VAMVQREVGERLAAAPGSGAYGVPSVIAQLACEVEVLRTIPRAVFYPAPSVDSVLVGLRRRRSGRPEPEAVEHAWSVVLDDHVDVVAEIADDLGPRLGGEIDAEVRLADVLLDEIAREPVAPGRRESSEVTRRWFDFDHFGAEVDEHASGVRAGQDP
ncbi:MAG: hypothetical protein GKR86_04500, partial [Ilumatobacter sp.]|nr:hypothetical protein [Ilumatobacter sp.]